MRAFVLRLDRGEAKYECFVQQLTEKQEDIFIVNFKDSGLIRLFQASKILLYINRDKAAERSLAERKESQLQEQLWNAIAGAGHC